MNIIPKDQTDHYALHYVASKVDIPGSLLCPCKIFEARHEGKHMGSILVNNYKLLGSGKHEAELTFAGGDVIPWTRHCIREIAYIVFEDLKCVRAVSGCAKDNLKSQEYLDRLGFTFEGRAQKGWDGERDKLWYGMTKDNCKWLDSE